MRAYGTKSGKNESTSRGNPAKTGSNAKLAAQNLLSSRDFHVSSTVWSLNTKNIAQTLGADERPPGSLSLDWSTCTRTKNDRLWRHAQLDPPTKSHSISKAKAVSFSTLQQLVTDVDKTGEITTRKRFNETRECCSVCVCMCVCIYLIWSSHVYTQGALREPRKFRDGSV